MSHDIPIFKCMVIGDAGIGKTTYINNMLTDKYIDRYIPTLGVEVHPLTLETSKGKVIFNCWDCAGQPRFQGLGAKLYGIKADCAIVMYDNTNLQSYRNVKKWIDEINEMNIPIVVCCNKIDEPTQIRYKTRSRESKNVIAQCDISVKCGINIAEPFDKLIKYLM